MSPFGLKGGTLPNGKLLLDSMDSGMNLHYKEVVGSDTLKGGYTIGYGTDDSMEYFYLRDASHRMMPYSEPLPWFLKIKKMVGRK